MTSRSTYCQRVSGHELVAEETGLLAGAHKGKSGSQFGMVIIEAKELHLGMYCEREAARFAKPSFWIFGDPELT